MAMDGNAPGAPRFSVGTVISTSLSVLFANIGSFLVIILGVGVPAVVLIAGASMIMAGSAAGAGGGANLDLGNLNATQILFVIFIAVLAMLAYLTIQAAVTYATLQS